MKNIAVIFAGGSGVRMNTRSKPKQFLELRGKPNIIYTLGRFDDHPLIDGIVVVCLESWIPFLKKMLKKFEINKVVKIVSGGDSGQDSIYRGLCAVEDYCKDKGEENAVVLIHDGVRPLIVDETITRNIEKVHEKGSAITVVPAIETFVIQKEEGQMVIPDRSSCLLARAPQSFYLKDILSIHRKNKENGNITFIDSCSMMSYFGYKMATIEGPMENIKITTPTDYFIFRAMVEVHENQQIFGF